MNGNFYPIVYIRAASTIPTWTTKSAIDTGLSSWTALDSVERGAMLKTMEGDTYFDTRGRKRRASVKFEANLPELYVHYDQLDAILDIVTAGSGAIDIIFRDPKTHDWIPGLFGMLAHVDLDNPAGSMYKIVINGEGEHRLKSQFSKVFGYYYWDLGEIGLPEPAFLIDFEHSPYELDTNSKVSALFDLSGNAIELTAPEANRPTFSAANGFVFNGTSQYLEALANTDVDITTEDFSFLMVAKVGGNGASSSPAWVSKYSSTGWVINSDVNTQAKIRFQLKDSNDVSLTPYALTTSGGLNNSAFHTLIGVLDRDTDASIYDGATVKGNDNPSASSATLTNTGKLRIADLAGANFANLTIKTIAIWKQKLDSTQRAAIVAYFGG